jgi:hypothetical protein
VSLSNAKIFDLDASKITGSFVTVRAIQVVSPTSESVVINTDTYGTPIFTVGQDLITSELPVKMPEMIMYLNDLNIKDDSGTTMAALQTFSSFGTKKSRFVTDIVRTNGIEIKSDTSFLITNPDGITMLTIDEYANLKPGSGVAMLSEIQNDNGDTLITFPSVGNSPIVLNGSGITNITANNIASGTLNAARIANASLSNVKIFDIDASKLTGTLNPARIADASLSNVKIFSLDGSKISGDINGIQSISCTNDAPCLSLVSTAIGGREYKIYSSGPGNIVGAGWLHIYDLTGSKSVFDIDSAGNRTFFAGHSLENIKTVTCSNIIGIGSGLTGFVASQIPNLDASKITTGSFTSFSAANVWRPVWTQTPYNTTASASLLAMKPPASATYTTSATLNAITYRIGAQFQYNGETTLRFTTLVNKASGGSMRFTLSIAAYNASFALGSTATTSNYPQLTANVTSQQTYDLPISTLVSGNNYVVAFGDLTSASTASAYTTTGAQILIGG